MLLDFVGVGPLCSNSYSRLRVSARVQEATGTLRCVAFVFAIYFLSQVYYNEERHYGFWRYCHRFSRRWSNTNTPPDDPTSSVALPTVISSEAPAATAPPSSANSGGNVNEVAPLHPKMGAYSISTDNRLHGRCVAGPIHHSTAAGPSAPVLELVIMAHEELAKIYHQIERMENAIRSQLRELGELKESAKQDFGNLNHKMAVMMAHETVRNAHAYMEGRSDAKRQRMAGTAQSPTASSDATTPSQKSCCGPPRSSSEERGSVGGNVPTVAENHPNATATETAALPAASATSKKLAAEVINLTV